MIHATVHVRDSGRTLRGPLPVTEGEAILRCNGVGTWQFQTKVDGPAASRVAPGGGVFVEDNETGTALLSGPLTKIREAASANGPVRMLDLFGSTDEQHLADREVYPDPTQPVTAQTATARYNATGAGETVIRNLVNTQAGPGAIVARRVPGLILETAGTIVGSTVTVSARFRPHLAETIAALADTAGVVWWIEQVGTDLVFRVSLPRDLTRRARFSRDLGNLGGYAHDLVAGTLTQAAVLGQGEGTLRTVRVKTNAAAEAEWGRRIERSIDRRDTDTDAELDQAGDEAILEDGPAAALEIETSDLPRLRYGRDYRLGDLVTVELGGGVSISDVVRQVTLTWTPAGVTSRPLIGPESTRDPREPATVRAVRRIRSDLGRLETSR